MAMTQQHVIRNSDSAPGLAVLLDLAEMSPFEMRMVQIDMGGQIPEGSWYVAMQGNGGGYDVINEDTITGWTFL